MASPPAAGAAPAAAAQQQTCLVVMLRSLRQGAGGTVSDLARRRLSEQRLYIKLRLGAWEARTEAFRLDAGFASVTEVFAFPVSRSELPAETLLDVRVKSTGEQAAAARREGSMGVLKTLLFPLVKRKAVVCRCTLRAAEVAAAGSPQNLALLPLAAAEDDGGAGSDKLAELELALFWCLTADAPTGSSPVTLLAPLSAALSGSSAAAASALAAAPDAAAARCAIGLAQLRRQPGWVSNSGGVAKWDGFSKLSVRLVEAKALISRDANGFSDPYCIVACRGAQFRTKTIQKTLNPVWQEEFHFSPMDGIEELDELSLFFRDKDTFSNDDDLGQVVLPLWAVLRHGFGGQPRWVDLEPCSSMSGDPPRFLGRVLVQVDFFPGSRASSLSPLTGPAGLDSGELIKVAVGSRGLTVPSAVPSAVPPRKQPPLLLPHTPSALPPPQQQQQQQQQQQSPAAASQGSRNGSPGSGGGVASARSSIVPASSNPLLRVRLIQARNLNAADATGYSDPYCVLKLKRQQSRSRTVPRSLHPKWNQLFEFGEKDYISDADHLVLTVFDRDLGLVEGVTDDKLGSVSVPVLWLRHQASQEEPVWLQLESSTYPLAGEVQIQARYIAPLTTERDAVARAMYKGKEWFYQLQVTVLSAVSLHGVGQARDEVPSPYCVLRCGASAKGTRSKVCRRSHNPVWNQKFSFRDSVDSTRTGLGRMDSLFVDVFSEDGEALGSLELSLGDVLDRLGYVDKTGSELVDHFDLSEPAGLTADAADAGSLDAALLPGPPPLTDADGTQDESAAAAAVLAAGDGIESVDRAAAPVRPKSWRDRFGLVNQAVRAMRQEGNAGKAAVEEEGEEEEDEERGPLGMKVRHRDEMLGKLMDVTHSAEFAVKDGLRRTAEAVKHRRDSVGSSGSGGDGLKLAQGRSSRASSGEAVTGKARPVAPLLRSNSQASVKSQASTRSQGFRLAEEGALTQPEQGRGSARSFGSVRLKLRAVPVGERRMLTAKKLVARLGRVIDLAPDGAVGFAASAAAANATALRLPQSIYAKLSVGSESLETVEVPLRPLLGGVAALNSTLLSHDFDEVLAAAKTAAKSGAPAPGVQLTIYDAQSDQVLARKKYAAAEALELATSRRTQWVHLDPFCFGGTAPQIELQLSRFETVEEMRPKLGVFNLTLLRLKIDKDSFQHTYRTVVRYGDQTITTRGVSGDLAIEFSRESHSYSFAVLEMFSPLVIEVWAKRTEASEADDDERAAGESSASAATMLGKRRVSGSSSLDSGAVGGEDAAGGPETGAEMTDSAKSTKWGKLLGQVSLSTFDMLELEAQLVFGEKSMTKAVTWPRLKLPLERHGKLRGSLWVEASFEERVGNTVVPNPNPRLRPPKPFSLARLRHELNRTAAVFKWAGSMGAGIGYLLSWESKPHTVAAILAAVLLLTFDFFSERFLAVPFIYLLFVLARKHNERETGKMVQTVRGDARAGATNAVLKISVLQARGLLQAPLRSIQVVNASGTMKTYNTPRAARRIATIPTDATTPKGGKRLFYAIARMLPGSGAGAGAGDTPSGGSSSNTASSSSSSDATSAAPCRPASLARAAAGRQSPENTPGADNNASADGDRMLLPSARARVTIHQHFGKLHGTQLGRTRVSPPTTEPQLAHSRDGYMAESGEIVDWTVEDGSTLAAFQTEVHLEPVSSLVLVVVVHRAVGLLASDPNGMSDPFVDIKVLGARGQPKPLSAASNVRTKVRKHTLAPVWNEEFVMGSSRRPVEPSDILEVKVWDMDPGFTKELLGTLVVPVSDARDEQGRPVTRWFDLQPPPQGKGGLAAGLFGARKGAGAGAGAGEEAAMPPSGGGAGSLLLSLLVVDFSDPTAGRQLVLGHALLAEALLAEGDTGLAQRRTVRRLQIMAAEAAAAKEDRLPLLSAAGEVVNGEQEAASEGPESIVIVPGPDSWHRSGAEILIELDNANTGGDAKLCKFLGLARLPVAALVRDEDEELKQPVFEKWLPLQPRLDGGTQDVALCATLRACHLFEPRAVKVGRESAQRRRISEMADLALKQSLGEVLVRAQLLLPDPQAKEKLIELEEARRLDSSKNPLKSFSVVSQKLEGLQTALYNFNNKAEHLKNLFNWSHPRKTELIVKLLLVLAALFTLVPTRYIVMFVVLFFFTEQFRPLGTMAIRFNHLLAQLPTDDDLREACESGLLKAKRAFAEAGAGAGALAGAAAGAANGAAAGAANGAQRPAEALCRAVLAAKLPQLPQLELVAMPAVLSGWRLDGAVAQRIASAPLYKAPSKSVSVELTAEEIESGFASKLRLLRPAQASILRTGQPKWRSVYMCLLPGEPRRVGWWSSHHAFDTGEDALAVSGRIIAVSLVQSKKDLCGCERTELAFALFVESDARSRMQGVAQAIHDATTAAAESHGVPPARVETSGAPGSPPPADYADGPPVSKIVLLTSSEAKKNRWVNKIFEAPLTEYATRMRDAQNEPVTPTTPTLASLTHRLEL